MLNGYSHYRDIDFLAKKKNSLSKESILLVVHLFLFDTTLKRHFIEYVLRCEWIAFIHHYSSSKYSYIDCQMKSIGYRQKNTWFLLGSNSQ